MTRLPGFLDNKSKQNKQNQKHRKVILKSIYFSTNIIPHNMVTFTPSEASSLGMS